MLHRRQMLLLVLPLVVWAACPMTTWSYERVIRLQESSWATDFVRTRDRFQFTIGIGYGVTTDLDSALPLYSYSSAFDDYLDRLDLEYASDPIFFRCSASALFGRDLGIWLAVPYAIASGDDDSGPARTAPTLKAGLGDVSVGAFFHLLYGKRRLPSLMMWASANSDTSKYYSFGDGLWNNSLGFRSRQVLGPVFYLLGTGTYTMLDAKNGVEHDDNYSYGAGVGLRDPGGGPAWLEFELVYAHSGDIAVDSEVFAESEDELALTISIPNHEPLVRGRRQSSGNARGMMTVTFRDLLEDLGDDNTIAFEYSVSF